MLLSYLKVFFDFDERTACLSLEERKNLLYGMYLYAKTGEIPELADKERLLFSVFKVDIDNDEVAYKRKCITNKKNGEKGGRPAKSQTVIDETEKTEWVSEKPNGYGKTERLSKNQTVTVETEKTEKSQEEEKEKEEEKEEEKEIYIGANAPDPMEELFRMEEEQAKKQEASRWKTISTVSDVDEIKKKTRTVFKKPTVEEIGAYCAERKNGISPDNFFDYYEAQGWKLSNGQKMLDWKAAVRNWETRNKKNGRNGNGWSGHSGDHSENSEEARNKYRSLPQLRV